MFSPFIKSRSLNILPISNRISLQSTCLKENSTKPRNYSNKNMNIVDFQQINHVPIASPLIEIPKEVSHLDSLESLRE